MTTTNAVLGDRIKQIRKQKGVSQIEAAEAAGIDPKSLSRIESGVFNPSVETLHGLAVALEVGMQDFFITEEAWARLQRGYALECIAKATDIEIVQMAAALEEILKRRRSKKPKTQKN
ncbi:helix-turn-helix domain-containing protein [Rugamonas apoptosis]|uniref:Helix-turn-helix transcriptional regulator n=1 Tax=Rugamonas apoptosis TaxID=2758570 RepID=A0A7W2FD31_9BURK|nr:helix-turn-helix transcriptional regulator [Rugamonas apoptosis]MBA5689397.1 helix-turn-helix transcriptional regulator [Rugamonas apoptosis]